MRLSFLDENKPPKGDWLCRYEETDWPEYVNIHLYYYEVIKRTSCGAWIDYCLNPSGKKFVNLKARKKFACETEEDARESFKRRKARQIRILKTQLRMAETALKAIDMEGMTCDKNRLFQEIS